MLAIGTQPWVQLALTCRWNLSKKLSNVALGCLCLRMTVTQPENTARPGELMFSHRNIFHSETMNKESVQQDVKSNAAQARVMDLSDRELQNTRNNTQ